MQSSHGHPLQNEAATAALAPYELIGEPYSLSRRLRLPEGLTEALTALREIMK